LRAGKQQQIDFLNRLSPETTSLRDLKNEEGVKAKLNHQWSGLEQLTIQQEKLVFKDEVSEKERKKIYVQDTCIACNFG
jgi:hypothetical protein